MELNPYFRTSYDISYRLRIGRDGQVTISTNPKPTIYFQFDIFVCRIQKLAAVRLRHSTLMLRVNRAANELPMRYSGATEHYKLDFENGALYFIFL